MTDDVSPRHTIVFVRHSKASHDAASDIERPLTSRGTDMAHELARELDALVDHVDLMLVSPALRAKETARPIRDRLNPGQVRIEDTIYESDYQGILELVSHTPESVRTLIVVGHEPWVSTCASWLFRTAREQGACNISEAALQIGQRVSFGVPTATALVLDCPASWSELTSTGALLRAIATIPS